MWVFMSLAGEHPDCSKKYSGLRSSICLLELAVLALFVVVVCPLVWIGVFEMPPLAVDTSDLRKATELVSHRLFPLKGDTFSLFADCFSFEKCDAAENRFRYGD